MSPKVGISSERYREVGDFIFFILYEFVSKSGCVSDRFFQEFFFFFFFLTVLGLSGISREILTKSTLIPNIPFNHSKQFVSTGNGTKKKFNQPRERKRETIETNRPVTGQHDEYRKKEKQHKKKKKTDNVMKERDNNIQSGHSNQATPKQPITPYKKPPQTAQSPI
jgi:hypothetical protein